MKILHICDIASVGKIICHELDRLYKIDCMVLSRKELDAFEFGRYYSHVTINHIGRVRRFALNVLKHALKYDIIHVHTWDKSLPYLRKTFPKKKIVMHYHGGDIRGQWKTREDRYKHADFIAVSTPRLLEGKPNDVEASWIPNPVDRKHYKRVNQYHNKTALYCHIDDDHKNAKNFCEKVSKEMGLNLTILYRDKNPIPSKVYPRFLELFEYFFDIKQFGYFKSTAEKTRFLTSDIGLDKSLNHFQALSLGTKVIYKNKEGTQIAEIFPQQYCSINVANRWYDIYEKLKGEK